MVDPQTFVMVDLQTILSQDFAAFLQIDIFEVYQVLQANSSSIPSVDINRRFVWDPMNGDSEFIKECQQQRRS